MGKKIYIKDAWQQLFNDYDILNEINKHGSYKIKADVIKTVKEPRLMAKFDQSSQLPEVFKDNDISILPVSRSEYILGRFKTHAALTYPDDVIPTLINDLDLETLNYDSLTSEANALMFAYNAGIIKDALASTNVYVTINGRATTDKFSFLISDAINPAKKVPINVDGAQIEIDGGFEDDNVFCIVEAKKIAVKEFIIRQLYYPYRLWKTKISKQIVPVFLVFSNDIFHVFIYQFNNETDYNSISQIGYKSYILDRGSITTNDILTIVNNAVLRPEPQTTFPQANSFERIFDLLSVLSEGELTKDETTLKYEFEPRQTDYYITAGEYLGLIQRAKSKEKGEVLYSLTSSAKAIMKLNIRSKYLALIKRIAEFPIFNEILKLTLTNGEIPKIDAISDIMSAHLPRLNKTTINRRASTVYSWVHWVFRQVNE
jgi:hypothetical protein